MKEMMIRCCCDCAKIGTVPVPEGAEPGKMIILNGLEFEVAPVFHPFDGVPKGFALKSRDYPLRDEVRIPGFKPHETDGDSPDKDLAMRHKVDLALMTAK